jgi:HK97 gp10 family phage protein
MAAVSGIKIDVAGLDALKRRLEALPRAVRNRVVRKAVNAGSTIVLQAARRKVPVRSRVLKKSLGRKNKTLKTGYVSIIGPRRGHRTQTASGRPYDPVFTAHLVEGGTKPHQITIRQRKGKTLARPQVIRHPGSAAQPFMKPALDDNRAAVRNAIAAKMREGIEQEARKR